MSVKDMTTREKDKLRNKMILIQRKNKKLSLCDKSKLIYGQQGTIFKSEPSRHQPTINFNHRDTIPIERKLVNFIA